MDFDLANIKAVGTDYAYDSRSRIGSGASSVVYEGWTTTEVPSRSVAVKVATAANSAGIEFADLCLEVFMHSQLQHPHVVKLLYYEIDQENQVVTSVLENMTGGTLRAWKEERSRHPVDERGVRDVVTQIASGILYFWLRRLVHRDLKPENVLLAPGEDPEGKSRLVVKLADFGFARVARSCMDSIVGSRAYQSPALLKQLPYNSRADLWSLGIMFYELLGGKYPFSGCWTSEELADAQPEFIQQARQGLLLQDAPITTEAKELVNGMLAGQMTWRQLFYHPFFKVDLDGEPTEYAAALLPEEEITAIRRKNKHIAESHFSATDSAPSSPAIPRLFSHPRLPNGSAPGESVPSDFAAFDCTPLVRHWADRDRQTRLAPGSPASFPVTNEGPEQFLGVPPTPRSPSTSLSPSNSSLSLCSTASQPSSVFSSERSHSSAGDDSFDSTSELNFTSDYLLDVDFPSQEPLSSSAAEPAVSNHTRPVVAQVGAISAPSSPGVRALRARFEDWARSCAAQQQKYRPVRRRAGSLLVH